MKKILNYYKELPKNEWNEMRKRVSIPEYILWWVVRVLMIYATACAFLKWREDSTQFMNFLQVAANLAVTFLATLLRVIFPKQIFLGRVPYAAQKYGMIIVFFGSFIGHHFGQCGVRGYDSFLHILSGFLLVFVCYEIVLTMQHGDKPVSGFIASVLGFGMNCFAIIVWEIFEFIVDYITGSTLQDYLFTQPPEDFLFFRLFGTPADMAQMPVLDTMLDMILALVSSIPAAAVLWAVVAYKKKKAQVPAADQSLQTVQK